MNLAHLVTVLLGGIAALDATPVAQTMLSQPLVTATLLGLVWGDLRTALEVGVVLQILAVSTQPLGARAPEDYATGGVVGTGLALGLASRHPFLLAQEASALLGVVTGIAVAMVGVSITKWQRRLNEYLGRWCERELRAGREAALAESHRAAVVLAFAVGVGYCAVCLGVATWSLGGLVGDESLRLARAWSLAEPLCLGVGVAHLLQAFVQRRLARGALFGAALVGAWILLMVQRAP